MTREDAYFERIMLICGFWDGYDEWLNGYLELEAPLSDIVLELVDCGNDLKEVEYKLNLYCLEKPFDEEAVHERLRIFLRESLNSGRMDKESVLATMGSLVRILPFDSDLAMNCSVLDVYYDLVTEKIIDADKFDKAFRDFLEKGKKVDTDWLWSGKKISFEDYNAYTENDIVCVSEKGIDLGELGFIDFQECANNFKQVNNVADKCVGERDISDYSFTFFTSPKPTMIKFIPKNKFFEFFSKENTITRFHKLQKQIVQYGYSSYDMT